MGKKLLSLSPHNDLVKSAVSMMWYGTNLISMKLLIKVAWNLNLNFKRSLDGAHV